jgi:predicted Fe-Mo cluster-binding NifX family protein
MTICIPTTTNEGKTAPVHEHFGSAPFYTLCDTETDKVEVIINSDHGHAHGMCQPLSLFADRHIDAVLSGGMGARAVQKLNQDGIRAYRAIPGTVSAMLEQFAANQLAEITVDNACSHHQGCH